MAKTQNGYMLVSIRKTITLQLWSLDKTELEAGIKTKFQKVVPYYNDDESRSFLEIDGQFIRIS